MSASQVIAELEISESHLPPYIHAARAAPRTSILSTSQDRKRRWEGPDGNLCNEKSVSLPSRLASHLSRSSLMFHGEGRIRNFIMLAFFNSNIG